MSQDLPLYSETMLRTSLQFADLDRMKGVDTAAAWEKADRILSEMEGAVDVAAARQAVQPISKESLLRAHALMFPGREGSGVLRATELKPLFRGQDCAPPVFIEKSIDNLMGWLAADSFSQIHPVERCALTITRIVDVWPFEFGNLTAAIVFANSPLLDSGFAPFSVPAEHRQEFEKAIAQSMIIDMQPLINAIYRTVRKEMEALVRG